MLQCGSETCFAAVWIRDMFCCSVGQKHVLLQCGVPFTRDDVIVLNADDEEMDEVRMRMEARKQLAKMEKVAGSRLQQAV